MNLAENIKSRREKLKLSQEYVAQRLGVSRQAVSKWETGLSEPTAGNLVKLAEILKISLSELVEPQNNAEKQSETKQPNLILRTNLIKLAIILHAVFIQSSVICIRGYLNYENGKIYTGFVVFNLVTLLLCSIWMASNHRFVKDVKQRRRNVCIELVYCVLQAIVFLVDIRFGLGLVGTVIIIAAGLVYILYINPKFMSRKLTK